MSHSISVRRRVIAAAASVATALALIVGAGAAPAQASIPLQLRVTWQLYGYEFSASAPFFSQNGYIVDRATEIAHDAANNCPLCIPATAMPAGDTNYQVVTAHVRTEVRGAGTLESRLGAALEASGGPIIVGTDVNTWGGVGTWSKGAYTWATVVLADYASAPLDELVINSVVINGTPQVGTLLHAIVVDNAAPDLSYQWMVDGADLGPASPEDSFQVGPAQLGHKISVEVDATEVGYVPASLTSAQVGPIKAGIIYTPKSIQLEGARHVGERLVVSSDTITAFRAPGVVLTYLWTRNGRAIPETNSSAYTLTSADLHHYINVIVTASATGYRNAVLATHSHTLTKPAL
jgi:hypothetical protein